MTEDVLGDNRFFLVDDMLCEVLMFEGALSRSRSRTLSSAR